MSTPISSHRLDTGMGKARTSTVMVEDPLCDSVIVCESIVCQQPVCACVCLHACESDSVGCGRVVCTRVKSLRLKVLSE